MSSLSSVASALGVTRLTHFTPAKNLPHILADGMLRSSRDLAANAPDHFSPTDAARFDNHPEMLCCTFEYPNGYYLAQARRKPAFQNYPDWACLLLDLELIDRPGTLFSPCNAARGSGAYLAPGYEGLKGCFDSPTILGYERGRSHRPGVPTDIQAEVLIPGPVSLDHVSAVLVPTDAAAENEVGRLEMLGLEPNRLQWRVSETFFTRDRLSSRLRYGGEIEEIAWDGHS